MRRNIRRKIFNLNVKNTVPLLGIGMMVFFLISSTAFAARNNCSAVSASDFAPGQPISQTKVNDLQQCIVQLYTNCLGSGATANWILSTNNSFTTEVAWKSPIRSEHVAVLQNTLTTLASSIETSVSLSPLQKSEELPGTASSITFIPISPNNTSSDQMSILGWQHWEKTPVKSQHFIEILNDINQFYCPICNINGNGCGSSGGSCSCPTVPGSPQQCNVNTGICTCPDGNLMNQTGANSDCGGCGVGYICASPTTCQSVAGVYSCGCPIGQTNCGGTCTEIGTNSNCAGDCVACASPATCSSAPGVAGTCQNPQCQPASLSLNGTSANFSLTNSGSTNYSGVCVSGGGSAYATCTAGNWSAAQGSCCPSGQVFSGGVCINLICASPTPMYSCTGTDYVPCTTSTGAPGYCTGASCP